MAYDFLGLVNDVNRRLNEVELDSSNFATAVGFYSAAKDAVNAAIRQINYLEYEWPFNHVTQEELLSVDTTRYSYPADAKTIDMDSFRIKRDSTLGNATSRLHILSYEEYLDRFVDQEYNGTTDSALPEAVFRTPDMGYGLVPTPDKAYTLVYEYYCLPVDLFTYTDVPSIPEQFRSIIVDGAMIYAYQFRGNTEGSSASEQKFQVGIKQMRSLYINRTDYIRSTVINKNSIRGQY